MPNFSAQHMTLARTYLEIGVLDEAVASLQTAVAHPKQRFEAAGAPAACMSGVASRRWPFNRSAGRPSARTNADDGRQLLWTWRAAGRVRRDVRALAVVPRIAGRCR